jgi:aminoglycoside 6'-N-acetyltransferase I
MTQPTRIRSARSDDIRGCLALARRAPTAVPTRLAGDLDDPERLLLVAESGGRVAGYGRAMRFWPASGAPADSAPPGYYLVGLVVDADLRRRGVGSALTGRRLAWIQDRAADAWYFASAGNAVSIALHAQFGFREVTRAFSFPDVTFDGEGILFRAELRDAPLAPPPQTP